MAVNKVEFGGNTLIDLTGDTLESAEQLMKGIVAHCKDGSVVEGTLEADSGGTLTVTAPAGVTVTASTNKPITTGAQLFNVNDQRWFSANCNVTTNDIIEINADNSDGTGTIWVNFYTNASDLLKTSTDYAIVTEVLECEFTGRHVLYSTTSYQDENSGQFAVDTRHDNVTAGVYVDNARTRGSFDGCTAMCRGLVELPSGSSISAKIRISVINDTSVTAETFVYREFMGGVYYEKYTKTKTASSDGIAVFKGLSAGDWTITITDGTQTSTKTVTITTDYSVLISFNAIPEFTYTGDYEIVNDADEPITTSQGNWKICFLTSGVLKFTALNGAENGIDLFLVGGGGAGGNGGDTGTYKTGAGGGGGYTRTEKSVTVAVNTDYTVSIGAGGEKNSTTLGNNGNPGGDTSAFGFTAAGGHGAAGYNSAAGKIAGGDGGSGGGGVGGNGGSDGADCSGGNHGAGQGTTTREFGSPEGTLFAGGGGGSNGGKGGDGGGGDGAESGADKSGTNGDANTGGGGGGGSYHTTSGNGLGGSGGSGIVIIRNHREAVTA